MMSSRNGHIRFFYGKIQSKATNGICINQRDLSDGIFNFKKYIEMAASGPNPFNFIQSEAGLFYTWDVDGSVSCDKYCVKVWNFKVEKANPLYVVPPPKIILPDELSIQVGTAASGRYFYVFYRHTNATASATLRCGIALRLFVVNRRHNSTSEMFKEVPLLDFGELDQIFNNSRIEIQWCHEDFLLIQAPYARRQWLVSCREVTAKRHPRYRHTPGGVARFLTFWF